MSITATPLTSPVKPAGMARWLPSGGTAIRFALVAVAVSICYLFEWQWMRALTAELNSRVDLLAGVRLQRLSPDTVLYGGAVYRYVIACTFADVWCGAIPLLWNLRASVARNLGLLAAFSIGLFAFNIVRLSFSDVLFAAGLPWDLAHNVISGVSYFVVWTWVWGHKGFSKLKPSSTFQQFASSSTRR